VRQWRRRADTADRSHRPHRLLTTLSPIQEAVGLALRQTPLLPLDVIGGYGLGGPHHGPAVRYTCSPRSCYLAP